MSGRTMFLARTLVLFLVMGLGWACDDPATAPAPTVEPGVGLVVDGHPLVLGDTLASLQEHFGPARVYDLGALGARFEFDALEVSGMLTGPGPDATVVSVDTFGGFAGKTPQGIGHGSTRDAVTAAMGAGTPDVALDVWWYASPALGVAFDGDAAHPGNTVVGLHLRAPAP